jgi:transcription elongation factor GreA
MKQISSEKVTYITPKGLEKLKNELEHLRTVKRREIADNLQETMGDVEDNEYLIALDEQAFVEGRIKQLEKLLCNAKVIQPGQQNNGIVDLGSTVVIRAGGTDAETYTIVGVAEADPTTGFISNESPLGKALLGSKVGDDLEVKAPAGLLNYRVLAVQ